MPTFEFLHVLFIYESMILNLDDLFKLILFLKKKIRTRN